MTPTPRGAGAKGPKNRHLGSCGFPVKCPEPSADRGDLKLLTDLARQADVDLGVTRDRSFGTVGRIGIDRAAAPSAIQTKPVALKLTGQWTEGGTSSIRSASPWVMAPGKSRASATTNSPVARGRWKAMWHRSIGPS